MENGDKAIFNRSKQKTEQNKERDKDILILLFLLRFLCLLLLNLFSLWHLFQTSVPCLLL